jgi:hypothetical protein
MEAADIKQHVSRSPHQRAYDTTFYARKKPNCYVVRKELAKLKPANLVDIYPEEFGAYLQAAWDRYEEDAQVNAKDNFPEAFSRKLCFSHFQKWRATGMPEFRWPLQITIPIRNARVVCITDDKAVAKSSPGTNAFVDRTNFKEVRLHLATDGKAFVPEFVPFWRNDPPFHNYPGEIASQVIRIIRKGMIVKIVKPFCGGRPPGKYRILGTRQTQLQVIPYHLANKPEACLAEGLPANAIQPRWSDFIQALGYELPHTPPAQPQSSDSGQA